MADNSLTERAIRIRRIKFRSWHRGIKEMDLILGHFADTQLEDMTSAQLDEYEELIDAEDTSLYNWITGREETPAEYQTALFERIRTFNHLEGTLWSRKP
ncbi:MAG: succinate dehydrogenase assembly factor 2 [Parvibaculaceae bacterium]